jgi:FtsP/CotA-like multicopper oxidase with cupredoxin domain
MSIEPHGRREFFAGTAGVFLCTLAGQKVFLDKEADVAKLAAEVPVPPKVKAAQAAGGSSASAQPVLAQASGAVREYWIQAEPRRWNIVPTKRDEMLDKKVKGKVKFDAYAYRPYSAGFAEPLGSATIPGPLLEVEVGETLVVNFRNKLPTPVTMHPHGLFYAQEMDGAYKGKYTDPSGFVQRNQTFRYVWDAVEGTAGPWMYHDHGPSDPIPVFKGLFGPIIVREPGVARPTHEFPLFFHDLLPTATGLSRSFSCVNGRAYPGNTPTLQTNVGDRVAFYVYGMDNNFHTFHVHGHRWTNSSGVVVDNDTFGPGDTLVVEFTEDNPGRWFYHCHVFSHLHAGMNGWYLVS